MKSTFPMHRGQDALIQSIENERWRAFQRVGMNYWKHGLLILTATLTRLLMSLFLLSFFFLLRFWHLYAQCWCHWRVERKKRGWPLFSSSKEKTLLTRLSVAYVNSTRCAHHMCKIYLSKSLYLSLFAFCHGKWVVVGQRFAQCWKGHNDDEFTLWGLLLLWKRSLQLLIKENPFVIKVMYIFPTYWIIFPRLPF